MGEEAETAWHASAHIGSDGLAARALDYSPVGAPMGRSYGYVCGWLHGLVDHRQQLHRQRVQVTCSRSRAPNSSIVLAAGTTVLDPATPGRGGHQLTIRPDCSGMSWLGVPAGVDRWERLME